ncbi:flagellar protein FliT [Caballeronia sp. LP006]|jgi:flagellar protein FliT|uniref:flagellar protein FliT n=1 Tax=unclassified Caballeronia TaxID=2646786 RepID=UPI001FD53D03|nr:MULTISPECIES: flagellar protein FliT [unclassified Caballeronia]MDR5772846.1 flagellar protein FliT [Caballeronia sp. LZ002]MDR5803695.1 flagellar protein FliT [Caballeronia sp. LZ001]MDR5829740.1 flagellar protein FliT [Caballeronia sp. LP006]MDR5848280.1 flagellar protein FliT [Caballeronia sp. LZ003]
MNTTDEYFAHYEAIAALSGQMLAAARSGEWSELKTMQGRYRELIERLKDVDTGSELDDTARARKLDLVKKILADDAAIRDLSSPSLARLSALFTTNSPARVLKKMIGLR